MDETTSALNKMHIDSTVRPRKRLRGRKRLRSTSPVSVPSSQSNSAGLTPGPFMELVEDAPALDPSQLVQENQKLRKTVNKLEFEQFLLQRRVERLEKIIQSQRQPITEQKKNNYKRLAKASAPSKRMLRAVNMNFDVHIIPSNQEDFRHTLSITVKAVHARNLFSLRTAALNKIDPQVIGACGESCDLECGHLLLRGPGEDDDARLELSDVEFYEASQTYQAWYNTYVLERQLKEVKGEIWAQGTVTEAKQRRRERELELEGDDDVSSDEAMVNDMAKQLSGHNILDQQLMAGLDTSDCRRQATETLDVHLIKTSTTSFPSSRTPTIPFCLLLHGFLCHAHNHTASIKTAPPTALIPAIVFAAPLSPVAEAAAPSLVFVASASEEAEESEESEEESEDSEEAEEDAVGAEPSSPGTKVVM